MRVLGIDPGLTTGLSLVVDGEVTQEVEAKTLLFLWHMLHVAAPDVLVVESMIGGPVINTASVDRAIGVCVLYAELSAVPLAYSNPSILQGKNKPKGLSPHIWAARVHALAYKE